MKTKTLISQDSQLRATLLQRGEDASTVSLRDLKRYYALLNYHLLELTFTANEASLVCEALKDYRFEDDSEQARTIWKRVDAAIQRDHLDQKWSVNSTFIPKLRALSHLQAIALVDAVERYWFRGQVNPDELLETKLSRVCLVKCCDFAL